MAKKLVIVESPAKAKTIGKILGHDFIVMPSVGHIRDLPEHSLSVDLDTFEPKYEISKNKTKVVTDLKKAVKDSESIYLAPDPDREGEAIAWHLKDVLSSTAKGKPFLRVRYNEITPSAVKNAIDNPSDIDMGLVDAQQARRVLDRIVGYKVSSDVLWKRIKRGLSAGRVQSIALRIVCEREREIQKFIPETYWIFGAILSKQTGGDAPFKVKLAHINGEKAEIKSEEAAEKVMTDLENRTMRVASINTRQITRRAAPPFITSTLQQAASSFLGYSPRTTMGLAQKLYEGIDVGSGTVGLITYMRTDAPAVAKDAQNATRDFIDNAYGKDYRPEKPNFYRGKENAQGAHEAIRPTDVTRTPESLAGKLPAQELKLYDLIWRRFVASQMSPARLEQLTVAVDAIAAQSSQSNTSYTFTATSSSVSFPGFMKVMQLDIRKSIAIADGKDLDEQDDDNDNIEQLPPLAENESLNRLEWLSDRKETKPPTRYSEASLVKILEEKGVGRPSTYASIIETLNDRKYVSRERRTLTPTDLGIQVCDTLVTLLPNLFDIGFTAEMENDLDEVEAGKIEWHKYMKEFYAKFDAWLLNAKEPPADIEKVKSVLAELEHVSTWAEPVKIGRSSRDDKKFVNSIQEQLDKGEKPISRKQLEAIVKIAVRYNEQLDGVVDKLMANGLLTEPPPPPLPPIVKEKLNILLSLELSENQHRFISSLNQQAESGRALSVNQLKAIDKVMVSCASKLPERDATLAKYGITATPAALAPDNESPVLLAALAKIENWREPTKQGKRVFDDKEFFESVSKQFKSKGSLSPKQRNAMRKMISRYKDQISDAAQVLEATKPASKIAESPAQAE